MVFKQTWVIAFYDARSRTGWWSRVARKGFGHLMIMSPANGYWTIIDSTLQGVDVQSISDARMRHIFRYLRDRNAVALQVSPVETRRYWTNGIFNCASLASRIVGLRRPRWFPYSLYRALLKNGATSFSLENHGD